MEQNTQVPSSCTPQANQNPTQAVVPNITNTLPAGQQGEEMADGLCAGAVYYGVTSPATQNAGDFPPSGTLPPPQPPTGVAGFMAYLAANSLKSSWQPFTATKADGILALACLLLGDLFIRWLIPWGRIGTTLFTLCYVAVILAYAHAKKIKPIKSSWYWLAILLGTSFSYAMFPPDGMESWRYLLLFSSALYWCGSLFGNLIAKKTSNYLLQDILNLLFVIPFKNFDSVISSFWQLFKRHKMQQAEKKASQWKPILLGLVLCVPILTMIFPMLLSADQGNFKNIFIELHTLFTYFWYGNIWNHICTFILGIPIAFYICGLIAGNAHKRYVNGPDSKRTEKNLAAARMVPPVTVTTVLLVVSVVYLIFIGCQVPYFFSAFVGQRPNGYEVYSNYARTGFFELCAIAGINLALLLVANLLCKLPRREYKWLKMFNIILSVLTIFLIITALSKMSLYIGAYGLTISRVLSSVFMLFIAAIYLAFIVLQYRQFSIVRFALVLGSSVLCLLCLCNLNGWVVRYNASQYIAGNLSDFDTGLLYKGNFTTAKIGMEVYQAAQSNDLKRSIRYFFERTYQQAELVKITSQDNISAFLMRNTKWPSFYKE